METNRSLVMVFADNAGNKKTLTINNPASDLEAATVSAQMDNIIASNILMSEEFTAITTKVSAKFVVQTKSAVTVTA